MYRIVLTVDEKEYSQPVLVEADPNAPRDMIAIGGGDGDDDEDDEEEARERKENSRRIDD